MISYRTAEVNIVAEQSRGHRRISTAINAQRELKLQIEQYRCHTHYRQRNAMLTLLVIPFIAHLHSRQPWQRFYLVRASLGCCVDLERALYPPGRAGIVDIDLLNGRQVGQGSFCAGNVDETTVARASISLSSLFLLLHLFYSPRLS